MPAAGSDAREKDGDPPSPPSVADLRAAFSGDRAAFQGVVEQLWDLIFVFVHQRVSDRDRAEDLTQDTFLQGWEKRETLRDPSRAVSWLLAIASRKVIDAHRRRGARPESPLRTGEEPAERDRGEATAEEEHLLLLQEALGRIPELYRTVLTLRYWSGLSPAQIARLLGEPEGTIRNRIFRAHLRLRGAIEAQRGGPRPERDHEDRSMR